MFREMRRKERLLDEHKARIVLEEGLYGSLATIGEDGYPYCTPLHYAYADNAIYFHSAPKGQKLDNIKYNERVCFSVVGRADVVPQEFSTRYQSVAAFGKATEVLDEKEKRRALILLVEKYSKDYLEKGQEYIDKSIDRVSVVKIQIEHLTGKHIE